MESWFCTQSFRFVSQVCVVPKNACAFCISTEKSRNRVDVILHACRISTFNLFKLAEAIIFMQFIEILTSEIY